MKDKLLKYAIAVLLGVLSTLLIFKFDFFKHSELFLYNLRNEFKTENKINPDILLITLDKETQKKYNYKQIPYQDYAKIIDLLEFSKVIGIDIPMNRVTNKKDVMSLVEILSKRSNVILSSQFSQISSQDLATTISYITPLDVFSKYTKYGYHGYVTDVDLAVRGSAFNYFFKSQGTVEESFCSLIAKKIIGTFEVRNNYYLINYKYKHGNFKKISFKNLIEDKNISKDEFKNKIVLIGTDFDVYHTPFIFNEKMLRIEIHANNILTIIKNNYIIKVKPVINLLLMLFSLSFGITSGFLLSRKKGIISIISFMIFYLVFNTLLYTIGNTYVNLLMPLLMSILGFITVKYIIYDYKNRELLKIKNIFTPYLTSNMIDEVINEKEYINVLKGERRVVSVLFSDIADFTSLSERLPTDQVVMILNEFLTRMTNIIFDNKGTLDKYTGDGVMAVFGNFGKVNIKENSIRAVKTALEMTHDLEDLQKKWINQGLMPLQIRIGICTGEVIVGNIGSPKQMDLTVIGDTVNTAARLEKMNKQLNTTILINKTTYEYVKDLVEVHSFGEHLLKGKNRKVEIFEVVKLKQ